MKRCLLITLLLIAFGVALVVQAQETPPITQQTVDAAVSTLLAQTRQAPLQIAATQTIQAALAQALAATAFIPPTPVPLNVSDLAVRLTTNVDLWAGPAGTGAYLAPDGEHFAYFTHDTVCLYQGKMQHDCTDLTQLGGIDSETVQWSPDSRYVAFTEDFLRLFRDADIWVWDTVNNQLHDLTDDGQRRVDFTQSTWTGIDLLPQWLPDGRILFLRYSRLNGTILPPDIEVIAPDGSGLQQLGALQSTDPLAIYALDVQGAQLIYNYAPTSASPNAGVWSSDLDGSSPHQIIQTDRQHTPASVEMSPDGHYVLVGTPNSSLNDAPDSSLMILVDVQQGQMLSIDPHQHVSGAGWSAQGSALVYLAFNPEHPDQSGLYVSETPGTPGRQLLSGHFNTATPRLQETLTWTANNTILLSNSQEQGIVLVHLE